MYTGEGPSLFVHLYHSFFTSDDVHAQQLRPTAPRVSLPCQIALLVVLFLTPLWIRPATGEAYAGILPAKSSIRLRGRILISEYRGSGASIDSRTIETEPSIWRINRSER